MSRIDRRAPSQTGHNSALTIERRAWRD